MKIEKLIITALQKSASWFRDSGKAPDATSERVREDGDLHCYQAEGPGGLPLFWGWETWGQTTLDDGSILLNGEFGTIRLSRSALRRWDGR